jgi:hypothetical protein
MYADGFQAKFLENQEQTIFNLKPKLVFRQRVLESDGCYSSSERLNEVDHFYADRY